MSNFNNNYRYTQVPGSDNSQLLTSRQIIEIPASALQVSPPGWDLDSASSRSESTTVFFTFTGNDTIFLFSDSLNTPQYAGDTLTILVESDGTNNAIQFGENFLVGSLIQPTFPVGPIAYTTFQFLSGGFSWALVTTYSW